MKFLCDQMLVRVGRWLRAAGHDTAVIENAMDDRDVFNKAVVEDRVLITRDRHFLQRDPERVIFLNSNGTEACIEELRSKVKINWLKAPFSRCLLCNTPLREGDPRIEKEVPQDIDRCWVCDLCGKSYWEGSHTERMLKQLKLWNTPKKLR